MKINIYHERQESSLCGQHCLNNLLQGPHFTAVELGEIANELDQQERLLGGINNYRESANVDDSGNFSIQVLRCALQRYCGADLVTWFHRAGEKDIEPTEKTGFVVNRSEHWFTIRKINNHWWNLNSTAELPELISPFYLSAFLAQLRNDGFSVFFVEGDVPDQGDPTLAREYLPQGSGHWYTEDELLGNKGGNGTVAQPPSFQAFQGKGNRLGGPKSSTPNEEIYDLQHQDSYDEDLELAKAISASLQETHSTSQPQQTTVPVTAAPVTNTHSTTSTPTTGGTSTGGTVAKPSTSQGGEDLRAKRLAALSRLGVQ